MEFEQNILELEGIQEIRNKWGYYTYNGIAVPRLTHILKDVDNKEYLIGYALGLGYKRYKQENEQVLKIGELVHEKIEYFLKYHKDIDNIDPFLPDLMIRKINTAYNNFKSWYNKMISFGYTITPIAIEYTIICQWFGGTIDCIMMISKGSFSKIYIVDFKTSKDIYPEYLLQVFGYRWAYLLQKDLPHWIDGIGIIRIDKNKPVFEDLFLDYNMDKDIKILNEIEQSFFYMLNWYYWKQQLSYNIKLGKTINGKEG